MAIYDQLYKKAGERHYITASIVNVRLTGEEAVLAGSSVSAVDNAGIDVSTSVLDQSTIAITNHPDRTDGTNCCLTIRCRAGTADKSPYKITFSVATTLGNLFQKVADLIIF